MKFLIYTIKSEESLNHISVKTVSIKIKNTCKDR